MTNKFKPPTIESYQDIADSLPEYWHKHLNAALKDAFNRGFDHALEMVKSHNDEYKTETS
jgi:hypothetical protein